MDRPTPGQNTGILTFGFGHRRERDWLAGAGSGITYEPRLALPDWSAFLPTNEWQRNATLDTMACVSFSLNNVVETQINWMLASGLISVAHTKWLQENGYLDSNNKINFSDRWLAKKSNTTPNGNYLVVVADTLRKLGAVPESKWPWDRSRTWSWDDYYSEPLAELDELGNKFLEIFEFPYEWVYTMSPFGIPDPFPFDEVVRHLLQAPLQLAAPICSPWNTDQTVQRCGILTASHATELSGHVADEWRIFDHYEPFKKRLAANYHLPYLLKVVANIRKSPTSMSPQAKKYLKEHDKELVLAVPSGRNAYLKGGVAREINTSDRGALAALAVLRENGHGGGIPDALYDEFPKMPF